MLECGQILNRKTQKGIQIYKDLASSSKNLHSYHEFEQNMEHALVYVQ